PAGSPGVIRMRGAASTRRSSGFACGLRVVRQPVLDVGLAAQASQPDLVLLGRLAVADGVACACAPGFIGGVARAPLDQAGDVPAELGAERRRQLARL